MRNAAKFGFDHELRLDPDDILAPLVFRHFTGGFPTVSGLSRFQRSRAMLRV